MLENLLDASISFYRDTFDVYKSTIPISATYAITFGYETFFSLTATPPEDVTIYLSGDRTENFNFYTDQEEARQGRIGFNSLTAITSNISAAGGTLSIVTTNSFGNPMKCRWLVGSYMCRVLDRQFVFPYVPLGEVNKAELKVTCGNTGMQIGDVAIYAGDTYNVEALTPISGVAGFDHCELILKRR